MPVVLLNNIMCFVGELPGHLAFPVTPATLFVSRPSSAHMAPTPSTVHPHHRLSDSLILNAECGFLANISVFIDHHPKPASSKLGHITWLQHTELSIQNYDYKNTKEGEFSVVHSSAPTNLFQTIQLQD